tara:strand:+ start:7589 stop:7828 length:240 start_codon:yes stop_codon:yes gene_type:complete
MYTRKQQMKKVKDLDFKIDRIESTVEKKVDDYLAETMAEVVQFNRAALETMKDILTKEQEVEFLEVMSIKMDEIHRENK